MIQNAEDAGARDVKFLYDKTQYGTDTLHHKDLQLFQVRLVIYIYVSLACLILSIYRANAYRQQSKVFVYLCLQGPALYAYNDATFSEDDWRGIKMLQKSIKKDDPLKVGRFGLGFKSVFHMTGIYNYM